jgi:hypothetical protein
MDIIFYYNENLFVLISFLNLVIGILYTRNTHLFIAWIKNNTASLDFSSCSSRKNRHLGHSSEIPEGDILHSYRRGNLKYYVLNKVSVSVLSMGLEWNRVHYYCG